MEPVAEEPGAREARTGGDGSDQMLVVGLAQAGEGREMQVTSRGHTGSENAQEEQTWLLASPRV